MASLNTNSQSRLSATLMAPIHAVMNGLWSLTAAQKINREAAELFAMSDEQLAARGMRREDISGYLVREYAHV